MSDLIERAERLLTLAVIAAMDSPEFIATAPTLIDELVEEVKRLRADLHEQRAQADIAIRAAQSAVRRGNALFQAVAALDSMVRSGERHTDSSEAFVREAQAKWKPADA